MKNNWKEEFDKEFQTTKYLQLDMNVYHVKTHRIQSHRQDIKDFIESLLAEQKKELMGTFVNIVEKEQSKNYPFYDAKDGWREGRQEIAEDILESLNHHE